MAWNLLLGGPLDAASALGFSQAFVASSPAASVSTLLRQITPLVALVLLQLVSSASAAASDSDSEPQCSKALGFNETLEPKDRSGQDLQFCREHNERTCCEKNHTKEVLNKFGFFAFERSTRCAQMSRLVLCSICDGDVGVGMKSKHNNVVLCPSVCARWFNSCVDDLFTASSSGSGLAPCTPSALTCSPLGEITSSAPNFCSSVGAFSVAESEDEADACYDGVPSSKVRGKATRAPWTPPARPVDSWMSIFMRDFRYAINDFKRTRFYKKLPRWVKDYFPGFIVAFVVILIGCYVVRSGD